MSRRIIYLFTSLLLTSVISSEALSAISAIDLKEKSHSTFFKPVYLYISTHEYSLAKQQLEKLPEQLLSTAEASYLKGLISFRLGSNLAATKYLKSSSDLARKNNYSLRIELARLYIELGKPQQAKTILLDVLKNSTNLSFLVIASKEIQYLEGMVSAKEDPTQAIKYFKELENSNPDDYRIPRILSSLYIKTGNLSDAEEALYRSLRTAKQYQSEVLYLFVDLYVQRNNVDLALSFFKRYKQTSINNHYRLKSANKLIRYADELIKKDELALAERIMVIVLDENVNIGNAIRAIVFLYLQNNDFEKAQRILDKYTKEDVDKDIILSLYYQLYSATNNLDKAIDLFESQARKNSAFLQGNALSELLQLYRKKYRQHLQSLPNNEIAAVNYAHFLLNNSLTDTRVLALEFCRALVEKLPKSADANYVYAQSLAENQFNTNALIYLSRAIRLSPNEIPWLFRYADLLEKTENYGAAINLLSTLSRHNREEYRNLASDKIDFVRGKVFISQKQYDQALRVYVGLLKSHPGDKEILEQLAIVYLANGNI
ncbi:MAG: tetratricopeptide repeat protein, partial [Gammaproteobacteria bacterium]|nr:tetratricopeptide repeat protein [Gammaproteobacteria bacterium]